MSPTRTSTSTSTTICSLLTYRCLCEFISLTESADARRNSEFVCHVWNMSFRWSLVIHLTKYMDASEICNKAKIFVSFCMNTAKISLSYFSLCIVNTLLGCNAFTI
uniref:Uncharacterized protein n=1 Tax=Triticum urartu TaxID=4572 RepID=A0A8R7QUU0_TRIUA